MSFKGDLKWQNKDYSRFSGSCRFPDFPVDGAEPTRLLPRPGGGSWTNPSDIRLKENIRPFNDGLNVIRNITPKQWDFNGLGGTPKGTHGIGVLAREARDVVPYAVSTYKAKLNVNDSADTSLYAFNPSSLDFILINSVKELAAGNEALALSVKALKSENEDQKTEISELKSLVCNGGHPEAAACRP